MRPFRSAILAAPYAVCGNGPMAVNTANAFSGVAAAGRKYGLCCAESKNRYKNESGTFLANPQVKMVVPERRDKTKGAVALLFYVPVERRAEYRPGIDKSTKEDKR